MHSTRPALQHLGECCVFAAAACLLQVALQVAAAAPAPKQPPVAQPRIAVLGAAGCIDDAQIEVLRSLGPVTVANRRTSEGETIELLKGATIAIGNPYMVPFTKPVLEGANSLKLLVMPITGFDRVDLDTAGRKGIRVVNSPDYSLEAVAEDAVALMLAAIRHVPRAIRPYGRASS